MHARTRIETVDERGYIHLQLEKAAGVKVRIIIEDMDSNSSQAIIPSESLALARMQEQTGFVKNCKIKAGIFMENGLSSLHLF
jgi:hypothetical protein